MSHTLTALATLPPGVAETAEVIARLDHCFFTGFGRMSEREVAAVSALPRLLAATPLGPRVKEAVDALLRSEFVEKHFATLACARAALQGAMADSLSAQASTALGRTPNLGEPSLSTPESPGHHGVFRESARHFLMEIALTGFGQLEPESLYPFYATLDKIQEEPALIRLSAILSGFLSELLSALPIPTGKTVPTYRWVDLWSRAMLLSLSVQPAAKIETVSGELLPLGCDLHHHRNLFSVCLHGLLRFGSDVRYVRTTVSAYKVDTVIAHEMWRLLEGSYDKLLKGIRDCAMIKLTDMQMLGTGDLLWDESRAALGPSYSPFDIAESFLASSAKLTRPSLSGLDRHPAQLAELFFLRDFKTVKIESHKSKRGSAAELVEEQALEVSGTKLPLSGARLSDSSGMTMERIAKASALVGLLRFDRGRWSVQPLAIKIGSQVELAGVPPQSLKSKDDTVAVLRERAGKLLRKKS
jgi:hypothetical protein